MKKFEKNGNGRALGILLLVLIACGLCFLFVYYEEEPISLREAERMGSVAGWFEKRIERRVDSSLQKDEKYEPVSWDGGSIKDADGTVSFLSDGISYPSGDWVSVSFKHTFKIVNKEGCESYYRKSISFDREGNMVRYEDAVDLTSMSFGSFHGISGFRLATDEELILWGENIVRKYIKSTMDASQRYVPEKWETIVKVTCDKSNKIDFNSLTFLDRRTGADNWVLATLYLVHNYRIEGPGKEILERNDVFFISPEGKVKVIPFDQMPKRINGWFLSTLFY